MGDVEVNYLAVVLAALSTMVVGSIWYAKPVFGKSWMGFVGLSDKDIKEGSMAPMFITMVVSLISAFVLAGFAFMANQVMGNSFLEDSLMVGFAAWLGFTAARFITHDAFEMRRKKLTLINISNEFVTIMVMALVIGLMGV